MKAIIAPLAALAAFGLSAGAASAASPTYCALYADAFVRQADGQADVSRSFIRDRAYHQCLNLDDEPALPASIERSEGTAIVEEGSSDDGLDEFALEAAAMEDVVGPKETAALDLAPAPDRGIAAPTSPPEKSRIVAALEKWSPEWTAWCAEHFPNSFDPETGTVVPFDTGVRTEC